MKSIFLFLSFTLLSITLSSQQTIYAEAGSENGRGILKVRGNECFAIIPNHLLRDHLGSVSVYGEGSVLAEGEYVKSYTSDLAILRFEGGSNLNCTNWKLDRDFHKAIDVITKCKLEMRERTGGVSTIAMSITAIEDQYLYIKPDNFREKITKGMSGSSVFAEYNGRKIYIGMLQSVDGNEGEILMADEIEGTLSDFFNPRKRIQRGTLEGNVSMGIVREANGFKFELLDIERSGSNLTMKFNAVSLNEDKSIYIHGSYVSLFDNDGRESKAKNIIIGSKSGGAVEYYMIHGVSVPIEIKFNDISSSANAISLINTPFRANKNQGVFEIRDIELKGETSFGSQYDGNDIEGTKVVSGFKFELVNISKTGQEVNCKYKVTSLDRDRKFYLHSHYIYLYDDKGFESRPASITIGSKTSGAVEYSMIHSVPVPVDIKFTTVNSSSENIALLRIPFTSGNTSAEYQERNIPFSSPSSFASSRSMTKKGPGSSSAGIQSASSGCSDIYIYRMKGIAQCEDNIQMLNHDEPILNLEVGTRYKTTVCEERELSLKATTGPQELIPGLKNADITLGKNYYYKVSCVLGTTVINEQEDFKAQEELNKKGKFKKQVQTFKLNDW